MLLLLCKNEYIKCISKAFVQALHAVKTTCFSLYSISIFSVIQNAVFHSSAQDYYSKLIVLSSLRPTILPHPRE